MNVGNIRPPEHPEDDHGDGEDHENNKKVEDIVDPDKVADDKEDIEVANRLFVILGKMVDAYAFFMTFDF